MTGNDSVTFTNAGRRERPLGSQPSPTRYVVCIAFTLLHTDLHQTLSITLSPSRFNSRTWPISKMAMMTAVSRHPCDGRLQNQSMHTNNLQDPSRRHGNDLTPKVPPLLLKVVEGNLVEQMSSPWNSSLNPAEDRHAPPSIEPWATTTTSP